MGNSLGKNDDDDELAELDLDFEINAINELIDLEQGRQAVAEKFCLDYETAHRQDPLVSLVSKTENRAVRVRDLRAISQLVDKLCREEKWVSTYNGDPLQPSQVNLYDLNYYLILPRTVPRGVTLMGLEEDRTYVKGERVVQAVAEEHHKYQPPVGEVQETTTGPNVLVTVKRGRFVAGREVQVEGESCGSPVFVKFKNGVRLSTKELLHPKPTVPNWFVSHSWGDSVLQFVERCELHARSYCTTWTPNGGDFDQDKFLDYSYWVCAYANNQHELAAEIVESPMQSAFMKALVASQGTLLMMDQRGTPFNRIWCDFELFMTVMSTKTLDLVAKYEKECFLLTEYVLPCDEDAEDKAYRDLQFPADLLAKGVACQLERGDASQQIDKIRILKAMACMKTIVNEDNQQNIDWNDPGPLERLNLKQVTGDEETAYRIANDTLDARFAIFAWPRAHDADCVSNYESLANDWDCGALDLPSIVAKSELLDTFEITLVETSDATFRDVIRGIPRNCRNVRIELHDAFEGVAFTNETFWLLWERLVEVTRLVHFDMKLGNLSDAHDDTIMTDPERGLAAKLPQMKLLETLVLDIEGDTFQNVDACLSDDSVVAVGRSVGSMFQNEASDEQQHPCALKCVMLDFGGWDEPRVFQMETADVVR